MEDVNETKDLDSLYRDTEALLDSISGVVLGKRDVALMCLVALISDEHILLEDVPGVGKTLMGKALANSVAGKFQRIQFTPDLLPSDIVGSSIFDTSKNEFVFNEGPIFANFVLADEINRAPPRTQSALLEAMSDCQVSVDGETYKLQKPFMVIATSNPLDFEGTYTLPESQLDRFLLRVSMGYPSREFEAEIFKSHRSGEPVDQISSVCTTDRIREIQAVVREVAVDDSISDYILNVTHATRQSAELTVGVSTRAALSWYRASQAMAFLDGRHYCIPDDAKTLAVPLLSHRVQLPGGTQGVQRSDVEAVINEIVSYVEMPS